MRLLGHLQSIWRNGLIGWYRYRRILRQMRQALEEERIRELRDLWDEEY